MELIPESKTLQCSNCGGQSIDSQIFQENLGGKTVTKAKAKYKEKVHGLFGGC